MNVAATNPADNSNDKQMAAGGRCYITPDMLGKSILSPTGLRTARKRRLVPARLQEIEGNLLSAEDIAMFEMFERQRWPHEHRRACILAATVDLAAE